MPRQNRVLPTGEIVAEPFRGTLMGNRGILHDEHGRLGKSRWKHHAWIACVLSFKGRHRQIMAPRRWTELFFADEAVSLAAGHRPCAECRRADFNRFRDAWAAAHDGTRSSAPEMDRVLQSARIDRGSRRQKTHRAVLGSLPDGVFIGGPDGGAYLLSSGRLHPYFGGRYGAPISSRSDRVVSVLTPEPTVSTMRAGYRPGMSLLG